MTMQQWLASEDVKTRQLTFKSPFPKRDRKGKPLKSFYTKDAIQTLSRAYVKRLKGDYLKDIAPDKERSENAEANYYKDTIKAVFPIVERIRRNSFRHPEATVLTEAAATGNGVIGGNRQGRESIPVRHQEKES